MRNVYEMKYDLLWVCRIFHWVLFEFRIGEVARDARDPVMTALDGCWCCSQDKGDLWSAHFLE